MEDGAVKLAHWLPEIPCAGMGWTKFLLLCFLLAIPGMLLLAKVAPWNGENKTL